MHFQHTYLHIVLNNVNSPITYCDWQLVKWIGSSETKEYLSLLMLHTMPSTSTDCSSLSCLMPVLIAMKQPVLPIPALQWKNNHDNYPMYKFLFLFQIYQKLLPGNLWRNNKICATVFSRKSLAKTQVWKSLCNIQEYLK